MVVFIIFTFVQIFLFLLHPQNIHDQAPYMSEPPDSNGCGPSSRPSFVPLLLPFCISLLPPFICAFLPLCLCSYVDIPSFRCLLLPVVFLGVLPSFLPSCLSFLPSRYQGFHFLRVIGLKEIGLMSVYSGTHTHTHIYIYIYIYIYIHTYMRHMCRHVYM
jgi:hypothetical protein